MLTRWLVLLWVFAGALCAEDWPQWRGPRLDGSSVEKGLPAKWGPSENVAWKVAMPPGGGATPIIWGDHVFVTVAVEGKLSLWALDRRDGAIRWQRPLGDGGQLMPKQTPLSPSPVTDGHHVWVMTDVGIVKCFDFLGTELWARDIQKDHGKFGLQWPYASSPLLDDGSLYVQVLHGMRTKEASYVLKLEGSTGKTVWRVERATAAILESADSYATPTVAQVGGRKELIVAGGDVLTGHDLETGKELWRGGGFNPDNSPFQRNVASPVVAGEVVYAPTRVRPLIVYRAGGEGDVTKSHQLWQFLNGPDVPTPAVDGEFLYSVNDHGVLYVLDRKTGKPAYGGKRLRAGTYSASPVIGDGRLFITNREGVTVVLKTGPKFELVTENEIGEPALSSLAISQGQIFLRTTGHLYCIGRKP